MRGERIDESSFLLTTLHSLGDRAELDRVREGRFEACMAAAGFDTAPHAAEDRHYADAYMLQANGDDGGQTPPPPRRVTLSDGTYVEVGATWTPTSCRYQAYASLGSDPFLREALRQRMTRLLAEADDDAIHDDGFAEPYESWRACTGNASLGPHDLLRELDGSASPEGRSGLGGTSCITDTVRQQATSIRAPYHVEAARGAHHVVSEWVALVDGEIAAMRSAG